MKERSNIMVCNESNNESNINERRKKILMCNIINGNVKIENINININNSNVILM